MDLIAVIGLISAVLSIGAVAVGIVQWLRLKRGNNSTPELTTPEPVGRLFDKEEFRMESTAFRETDFSMDTSYVGPEGRAVSGAVATGKSLVVKLQDCEESVEHVGVWLTIENRGTQLVRWFGPVAVCYPHYVTINADTAGDPPAHFITDLYPSEQVTAFYRFTMTPPSAVAPKCIACKSWDEDITFWWARGA